MADHSKLSVPKSIHMEKLLQDGTLCKNVATFGEDLSRILSQIQTDICTEENRDIIGPTVLALKHVQDTLLLFSAKGNEIIKKENQSNAERRQPIR